ncbi:MAG: DUF58 domain-containing protein [Actinobacteria bacterium]|nr:DUF58 domain-containing protein [Actinomycetota bacterium]MCG2798816.1 DUF58 domain-containing protein [Cellulomonas sp.]
MRPTPRGWTLLGAGLVALQLGFAIGSPDLVRIGLVALGLVAAGTASVLVRSAQPGGRGWTVTRAVLPRRLHIGATAAVQTQLSGHGLRDVALAERAAPQLSGAGAPRARVRRSPGVLTLDYQLHATARGRWPLGPLIATRTDPFGVIRRRGPVGATTDVLVWPTITELTLTGDVVLGEPDRVALGVRSPSPDDTALRDYHEGDDLRRVHWASTARRGRVMVRADEHTGMRAVDVLLERPSSAAGLEWTLSVGASIALSALTAGHPVRLLGVADDIGGYVHPRHGDDARATLLDPTVDATTSRSPAVAGDRLVSAVNAIGHAGQVVVAVIGAVPGSARTVLAGLPAGASCWVLVRADGPTSTAAQATLHALRQTGWHGVVAHTGEDPAEAWRRLAESAA